MLPVTFTIYILLNVMIKTIYELEPWETQLKELGLKKCYIVTDLHMIG